ncbi:hypothetical protein ACFIJ5_08255 [Haloimpatiens sp. FM7330]|uniref:hypothetical protein n=1 Tax=Haloimpatiens sp. FM7330 TaxID=3298610 RepID=UPI003637ECAF
MKKKFLSLLICAATCVSFASMQAVQAQTNDNVNNQKIETKDTTTKRDFRFKLTVKEIKETPFTLVGKKEYKNPPKLVKGVLSKDMDLTVDNIMSLFEKNKDIFKIDNPRKQLMVDPLAPTKKNALYFVQNIDGFAFSDNYYRVSFKDDNKTIEVWGNFDNSLYDENSSVKIETKLTKKDAFETLRNDALNNIDKYTNGCECMGKKSFSEKEKREFMNKIKNADYTEYNIMAFIGIKDYYLGISNGEYCKYYYIENFGNYNISIDAVSGKISLNKSCIQY